MLEGFKRGSLYKTSCSLIDLYRTRRSPVIEWVCVKRSLDMKQDEAIMSEAKMKQPMRRDRPVRQNLLLLTLIYLGLMLAGGSKLSAAFAIPHDSAEKALAYMTQHGWTIQLGSFIELLSAIPLGVFIATTVGRMRSLGVRAAGESIASLGGVGATLLLVLAALTNWSLARPGVAEAAGAGIALRAVSFAAAGPGFVVMLGFFVAGVSIAAGLHRNLPRWLMWFGIVIALACELAALTVLNFTAGYFIPVGRFGSIVWMIGVSLTLRTSIADSADDAEIHSAA
jgi:hypothetical protein